MAMANKPGYGSHPEHNSKSNMGVAPVKAAHGAVSTAAPKGNVAKMAQTDAPGPGDCPAGGSY